MKKLLLSTLLSIGILFVFGSLEKAYAADICWDGGGSTNNWSEDANWAGNTEPGGSDVAVFDNGTCSGTPNKNASIDVDTIVVAGVNMVAYSGTISLDTDGFVTAAFTQGAGVIDLNTGTMVVVGDFTRTGGTFTADNSIVLLPLCSGCTFSGSTTFNDLTFVTISGQNTADIASGTTLTVTGVLTLDGSSDANDSLDGPGGISAQGDISIVGEGIREGGSVVITINGTGTQTLDGEGDDDTRIPNVTIDKSSGTLNITDTIVVSGDWVYEQGTISPGSSTIVFLASASSIDGSHTLANASIVTTSGSNTRDVTSGTTLTLTGNLTIDGSFDANDSLAGPGEIHVQGNISVIGEGVIDGDLNIVTTGTGTQTLDGEVDDDTKIPSFEIDKSNGTLNITDNIVVINSWTYTQGTVNAGSSHVYFIVGTGTISGSHTLNDVTFFTRFGGNTKTVASGTTITVSDDLVIDGTDDNNDSLDGPGTVAVQGDLTIVSDGIQGSLAISFTGTNSQIITTAGTTLSSGTWTINKSSGTVTLGAALTLDGTGQDLVISSGILDMSTFALTVDDVITINGGLRQGSGNLTASNGNVTVGSTGWWLNNSTGDIDAEGGDTITNNGYVRWDGTSAGCGGADGISLTRNGSGAVNLAGSGRWRVYDITIGTTGIYAASPALTIYSSSITGTQTGITNNGTCPSEVTWDGGHASDNDYDETTNWTGDALPTSADLAVFDATSTDSPTINVDPNDNGFQINLGFSGTITQSNGVDITLDDQGWEQNAGTFTGGNASSDITLNNGGDFLLILGTFTTPGGSIVAADDWTISGGTFTASSGTVELGANDGSEVTTGSSTYNNLTLDCYFSDQVRSIASGTILTVNGTLHLTASFNGCQLDGTGAIHAKAGVTGSGSGWYGDLTTPVTISINGTGSQTIDAEGTTFPNITLDKSSGSVTFTSDIAISNGNLVEESGNSIAPDFTTNSTTVLIAGNASGSTANVLNNSFTFYNLTFECSSSNTLHEISNGESITVNNLLYMEPSFNACSINGPGAIHAKGNVTTAANGYNGTAAITLNGTGAQVITQGGDFPDGTITINKTSGTVTLGAALNLNSSGQDLTITDGELANSSYNLTINDAFTINDTFTQGTGNVSAASYTVGASGGWTNTSTGDITVGTGGVTNSGTITLGDINTCGGANNIAITSSSGGQQRSWSSAGTFNIYDTTVQDQGGSASITAYSSQNVSGNGGNWTFNDTCPPLSPPDIRMRGGATLRGGTRIL